MLDRLKIRNNGDIRKDLDNQRIVNRIPDTITRVDLADTKHMDTYLNNIGQIKQAQDTFNFWEPL